MIVKDIINFEGLYNINQMGVINSLERTIVRPNGVLVKIKGKIKKNSINPDGYEVVTLYKNNIRHDFYIHRLLAYYFIENPNNYLCVNHKNGIRNDNKLSNLEWCSYSENNLHSYRVLGKVAGMKGKFGINPKSKKINQYDLNGNNIGTFLSITDCARKLGLSRETIRDNVNGKIKIVSKKYKFTIKND